MKPFIQRDVQIPSESATLQGVLCMPAGAAGVVLFAHGSGSSRSSPRNVFVARVLQEAGLATGRLEEVARLAAAWFSKHRQPGPANHLLLATQ